MLYNVASSLANSILWFDRCFIFSAVLQPKYCNIYQLFDSALKIIATVLMHLIEALVQIPCHFSDEPTKNGTCPKLDSSYAPYQPWLLRLFHRSKRKLFKLIMFHNFHLVSPTFLLLERPLSYSAEQRDPSLKSAWLETLSNYPFCL